MNCNRMSININDKDVQARGSPLSFLLCHIIGQIHKQKYYMWNYMKIERIGR